MVAEFPCEAGGASTSLEGRVIHTVATIFAVIRFTRVKHQRFAEVTDVASGALAPLDTAIVHAYTTVYTTAGLQTMAQICVVK